MIYFLMGLLVSLNFFIFIIFLGQNKELQELKSRVDEFDQELSSAKYFRDVLSRVEVN